MFSIFRWKSTKDAEVGNVSQKRQRIESETGAREASGLPPNRDEFLITLDCYGTIKLSKAALQLFPTSLLSVTLLGDGIDEHSLYVPIGRGHDSFPRLIKDIYDLGAPLEIPPLGLPFDLFVKWLRYLGLGTWRSLSTESAAAKRVSYFVETLVNTQESYFGFPQPCPEYGSYALHCVCMPPDVKRHLHNLLPFEFARRGIHMSVEMLPYRLLMSNDVNLPRLVGTFPMDSSSFRLNAHFLSPEKDYMGDFRVTGVYPLGQNPVSPFGFEHGSHPYELSWTDIDGDLSRTLDLVQLDAGGSFDGRDEIEAFVVVKNRGVDLVKEFKKGDLMYSNDEHGFSLVENFPTLVSGGGTYLLAPFIHSLRTGMIGCQPEDLESAYLLVVKCEAHPRLRLDAETDDSEDVSAVPYRFTLEESPEWALESDGQPPLHVGAG